MKILGGHTNGINGEKKTENREEQCRNSGFLCHAKESE